MKRGGPLKRTPLQRKTELRSSSPLRSGSPAPRTGRLRARSKKQEALDVQRRPLVAALLEVRPWCEIRWDDRCTRRAVDVDEIVLRSQGGSILDPTNLQTACRACHAAKHDNPAEAVRRGLTIQRRAS